MSSLLEGHSHSTFKPADQHTRTKETAWWKTAWGGLLKRVGSPKPPGNTISR